MMTINMTVEAAMQDAELVRQTRGGNRDAFGQIVSRYQSLVCSLAYSATGSLGQSEDLAQETFITAWKHLGHLREPQKLRAWLCGIARNRINNSLRREGRQAVNAAQPLESIAQAPSPEPLPREEAISKEEEAILWRSLERVPENYREPLILFYREHQSVEKVAEALELSEDAVKQRLSRGRKLLQEEVLSFVEGVLERTKPGKTFTVGVLAALPLFTLSAQAATLGAAVAKGGAASKAAGWLGVFGALFGPLAAFLGVYFGYRLDRDSAQSSQRREFVVRYYRILATCIAVFMLAILLLVFGAGHLPKSQPRLYVTVLGSLGAGYILVVLALTVWMRRSLRRIARHETLAGRPAPVPTPVFEYRSRLTLLGWPLVHVRLRGGLERGPVKAWIAAGDVAVGVIFAFGGVAIAPLSFGGIAVGVLPFGGFAAGPFALGGISLAIWSLGGFAAGWEAFGGCAIAWKAALGGAALAHDYAIGGIAQAIQANNAAAQAHIQASWFFANAQKLTQYLGWVNLLWALPAVLWWRVALLRRKAQKGQYAPPCN